ncbi:MAG: tetratricopeptide repeat protein [Oscillospiraceae bacterium]|nr:tetratricopeptide repeat protein [Oscillospiraceae bacterium]
MNLKLKMAIMSAAVVLMLAAAAGIILSGQKDNDLDKQLERAGTYLVNSDYDNAIAIYNRIISADSSCAEAYAGLSEAYFAKNKADKAFDVLKKGAEKTDNDKIVTDKMNELFPDMEYAEALYGLEDDFDDEFDDDFEDNAAVTDISQAETAVTETTATDVPEESETETSSETVTETETTTSATTAAPVVTTAPPVTTTAAPVVTTAPPVTTTAPPATTTTVPTTRATTVTTTVTTTEALKDVAVTDFTLMTLDEAYAWCSKNNLILSVVGSEENESKILSQSPAPSAVVKENSTVIVILAE